MKIIKLQIILLFSLMLAAVACSDDKDDKETNVPQITTPLPGVDTPQIAGNELTIKGSGFKEGCEIELKKETNDRTTARTITIIPQKVTPTSVVFIIPEGIDGIFIIVIKQDNKEYVIGKISVKSNLTGIWKWEKSYIGEELHETHANQYFVLNSDGSGYYQDENEKNPYTWTLDGKIIKISYENEETLEVTITNINANELEISYVEDNKKWIEILTKFTGTISIDKPEATTLDATEVTDYKAVCEGQFKTKADIFSYGICYSQNNKTPEIETDQTITASSANENNIFQVTLNELTSGITFYYRAFLIVNDKTYYGEVKSFTTINVKTLGYEKTKETAICSGQYLSSNEQPTEYGICYSTSVQSPTTSDKKIISTNVDKESVFTATILQLEPEVTYYYRAYSVIGNETYYGDTKSFTTISVKTLGYEKTKETAICSGQYLSGNEQPTEYGICYSTSAQSPTISDKKITSTNINAEGVFTATITQLKSEKTYYYRAYSVVGNETYYGDAKSFTTERSFPIGTWKQTLLEITEKNNGEEFYTKNERNFIFIYLESGKIGTLDSSGKLTIDDKSSYSYDDMTQTLSSSYYKAESQKMHTETGKITFTEEGFKLTIYTKDEHGERTAVSTYIKQPDAEGTY